MRSRKSRTRGFWTVLASIIASIIDFITPEGRRMDYREYGKITPVKMIGRKPAFPDIKSEDFVKKK